MVKRQPTDPLPIFEGLTQWGEARLVPKHLENLTTVEVKRIGHDEQWKPLFHFVVIDGRIACRMPATHNDKVVVYDPITNTISDVTTQRPVRDDTNIRKR